MTPLSPNINDANTSLLTMLTWFPNPELLNNQQWNYTLTQVSPQGDKNTKVGDAIDQQRSLQQENQWLKSKLSELERTNESVRVENDSLRVDLDKERAQVRHTR